MSIESFCNNFYKVDADEVSKEDALDHSIAKWSGLTRANLQSHDLRPDVYGPGDSITTYRTLYDEYDDAFHVDANSCALCVHHENKYTACRTCPLALVRGDIRCDKVMENERESPYNEWIDNGNNEPMLQWLLKARDHIRAGDNVKYRRGL